MLNFTDNTRIIRNLNFNQKDEILTIINDN